MVTVNVKGHLDEVLVRKKSFLSTDLLTFPACLAALYTYYFPVVIIATAKVHYVAWMQTCVIFGHLEILTVSFILYWGIATENSGVTISQNTKCWLDGMFLCFVDNVEHIKVQRCIETLIVYFARKQNRMLGKWIFYIHRLCVCICFVFLTGC